MAWLVRIARNASIDAACRTVLIAMPDPSPIGSDPGPCESVMAREAREALMAAVRSLPDVQRDAVLMRYAAGLSTWQIAAIVGKSEAATEAPYLAHLPRSGSTTMPTADSRSMAFDGPLDAALYRLLAHDPPSGRPASHRRPRVGLDRGGAGGCGGRAAVGRRFGAAFCRSSRPPWSSVVLADCSGSIPASAGRSRTRSGWIWMRGVDPDVSQTIDGYSVALDRAYLDANRLVLAIRVVDELERRDEPGLGDVHAGDRCEW